MPSPFPVIESLPADVAEKFDALERALASAAREGLLIAYSGGVDSAFLAWAAERVRRTSAGRVVAVTAVSASLAAHEREDALRFAREIGIEHILHDTDELSNPDYVRNDGLRCYHCKTELFTVCGRIAREQNLKFIAYGYNASDEGDNRPGHRAANEHGILSPLRDAGLRKDDIRALMRKFGLTLAEKPASPCLSSRLMTGVAVTPEKLRDVEDMETLVRASGIEVFRVRLHEQGQLRWLRLELLPADMPKILAIRDTLHSAALKRGFAWMTLDLAGYRMGGGTMQRKP